LKSKSFEKKIEKISWKKIFEKQEQLAKKLFWRKFSQKNFQKKIL